MSYPENTSHPVTDQAVVEGNSRDYRSGFVAIVGRPNVGKSTLLNQILGQKVAIVSHKPQTTRGRILGILTRPAFQIIFVDTPGLHRPRSLLNKRMVQVAESSMEDADVVLWVTDVSMASHPGDKAIAETVRRRGRQSVVAVNKIDVVGQTELMTNLIRLAPDLGESDLVPVSARTGENIPRLLDLLAARLPAGGPLYDSDLVTDQSEKRLVEEVIREKVLLQTSKEVPYATAVTVDTFSEKPERNITVIQATIHVERASQKAILIGSGGTRVREVGTAARVELEKLLDRRVFLELFVRVQEEWTKDERRLREFGL